MSRLNRFLDFLEGAFIIAAAVISFFVAIADLFGFLDNFPLLAGRTPVLTLLLLSLALGIFFLLQRKQEEFGKSVEEMSSRMDLINQNLTLVLSRDLLADINGSLENIDVNLRTVFESDIKDLIGSMAFAISESSIKITEVERYRYYYIRMLERFPKVSIAATSLPSSTYFWGNQAIETAISKFISEGGKFKRIFFLKSWDDLQDTSIRQVLRKQIEIGVETYVVPITAIPAALYVLLVIEEQEKIGWQIYVDADGRIISVTATTNKQQTQKLRATFEQLLQVAETKKLTADDVAELSVIESIVIGMMPS